ncbi:MAG TPA: hypothetical protein VFJ57_01900 [Solirubrobacterales bacterium]|nr:hypothetical protein [Solirubrobacterales bacterium]
MPEERQIGRTASIDRLQAALMTPAHQWMIGERRIGKTSVAKAVLARFRREGAVALDIDLSRPGVADAAALAGEIARQAQAAGVGNEPAARKILGFTKKERPRIKDLGEALTKLGLDEAQALGAVASILAGADEGGPGLNSVMRSLALHATATERRVYVLFDEVHRLAEIDGAEREVAGCCRERASPIVFIFAGSEESAAQALREPGRPLIAIGEEFELSQIAWEEWMLGLRERFTEAGIQIDDEALRAILGASRCHPRRTMLVASRVQRSVAGQPDGIASGILVEVAIKDAEGDRSWRQ